MENSILLQNVSTESLVNLIEESIKKTLHDFKQSIFSQKENNDLLTRTEACKFLKIDKSTLWNWTNKGKIISYGIVGRVYYKRSELLECLKPLKN